jgi:putative hydrolase of the HAD superfamily
MAVHALSIDLDDTLWPIAPVIGRAEQALHDWLSEHCPDVASAWPIEAMRALRDRIFLDNPALAHDFSALRTLSLRAVLGPHGYGDSHVERAFEVFYAARNRVELYPDAVAALPRLAARWPLASLSNGNADLARIGLEQHFMVQVSARGFGAAKPDARIFRHTAALLGHPPGTVAHIGDDPELDVIGARRAGMIAVWLNRNDDTWAHRDLPDVEIRNLDELESALDRFALGATTRERIA